MEAGIRADLNPSRLLTVPKRDTQRAVLQFVNGLRSFSRVHAAEGKVYMTSWDAKETFVESTPTEGRNPRSCGFATPVLKPRVVLRRRIMQGSKSPESPSTFSSHIRAKSSGKAASKTPSKEGPPRHGRHSVKRDRELQSDEEKRLHERREKKRAKREIMRPGASKKQAEEEDQSREKSKSRMSKKIPTGLALMYGFTATNVGKNRLTVEPSFRSGVFGKGKASAQARLGQSKLKGKSFVFSEEEFLKSATTTEKRRRDKGGNSTASGSQSSRSPSECTDNEGLLRQRSRRRTLQSTKTDSMTPLVQGRQKIKIPQDNVTEDKTGQRPSRSSSEKAQSIVWDIEKDDGVLPAEASSVSTRGSKVSTILLNIRQERWLPEFSSNKRGACSAQVQELSVQQKDIIDDNDMDQRSVAGKEQDTSSSVFSVRPSESLSQAAHAHGSGTAPQEETVSKYFNHISSFQVHPPGEPTCEVHANPAMSAVPLPPPVHDCWDAGSVLDDKREPLHIDGKCEGLIVEVTHQNAQAPLQDVTNGSDWLLSDPILSPIPNRNRNCGTELFHLEGSEEIRSNLDTQNTLSDESAGLYRDEGSYLARDTELGSLHDHFPMSEPVLSVEDVCSEDYEYDHPLSHLEVHVEEAHNQPITFRDLTEWDNHSIQTVNGCDEASSLLLDRAFSPSFGSDELMFDGSDDLPRGPLLRFDEGRCLLLGTAGLRETMDSCLDTVEADVARHLIGHWVPQRY